MFYYFNQNNSGGGFDLKAEAVIVEANSADEANTIAQTVGVYFDGVAIDEDCECCGDRWYAFEDAYTYDVFATLDDVMNAHKYHFSYSNDFAIVVPNGSESYRLAENPHAPRCTGTTKKGERCKNGAEQNRNTCDLH